jgi:hypothetical protein
MSVDFHMTFSMSLFRPLASTNEQVFLGVPDLTIVQNPHACCKNAHVQIMNTIKLWNLPGTSHCAHFAAPSEILTPPTGLTQIPHRHLIRQ